MIAFARWFFALFGGVLLGAGLVLHGQVAVARVMRQQVHNTFFLWRAIGEATFALQGDDVRIALWLDEVPESAIRDSDRAAWMLVIVGSLVGITGPLLRRPASKGGKAGGKVARTA